MKSSLNQKSRTKTFFLLSFILLLSNVKAEQITVKSIPPIKQLPSNSVMCLFQDKEGFLWFGTVDGLCRYDGYHVSIFRGDIHNPDLLTDNEISCITEDHNNQLWIGTKKGITILDKSNYQISHLERKEISQASIRYMRTTRDGSIWVAANTDLFRYNPDMSLRKNYKTELPGNAINTIFEDNEGNIWITLWEGGLFKYNPENDSFIAFPRIGRGNNPFVLFQDDQMNYWIGTWGNGLYLFYPDKKGADMYIQESPFNDDKESSVAAFYTIVQDNTYGYIWAMSFSGLHIFKYDEEGKVKRVPTPEQLQETNNIFNDMIKDSSGNLWIGSFNEGVVNVSFDSPLVQNYSLPLIKEKTGLTPNIQTIYEDHEKDIWFQQNRYGVGIYTPSTGKTLFHPDIPPLNDVIGISCMADFRLYPNEIWVGFTYQALIYRLAKKEGNIQLIESIDLHTVHSYPGSPTHFFEDRKNNIWIITTEHVFIKPYYSDSLQVVSGLPGKITGITEDTRGEIWLSSIGRGIFQLTTPTERDKNDFNIRNYNAENSSLSGNNFETICSDNKGYIWMGSKEGQILTYDIVTKNFMDKSELFNISGERLLNILTDDYDHLWISTTRRLIEFNPENEAIYDYVEEDGILVNSFLKNSFYKKRTGEILFGGNKGISMVSPSHKLIEQKEDVKVLITDVKTDNQSVFHGNNNHKFDILSQTIVLGPEDKNIEIDFSTLNYTSSYKIQYAYKLEGVDKKWRYTDAGTPFAIYNTIGKGNHTFRIRATDKNRLWSEEITSLSIYKQPHFYETWWAYMIYTLVIVGSIYFSYIFISKRVHLQNKLKIAEIEKQKSEELTQIKLRYFTNITHDILTPLTIISCLIDDAETTSKEKFHQFSTIRSNLNRLRRLLQQILDFRKVESGNMKLKISQGDIVTFIRDICYNQFLPLMSTKDISFSFTADPIQIPAYFDADKIDKTIFNLLSNAFKYTEPGGKVDVSIQKEEGRPLIIKVSDTGIGIAAEDMKNIFTRFYTKKMGESGDTNGIGLSLIRDLLELHHGTIRVESEVGKGSCFIIELPVDKDDYSYLEAEYSSPIIIHNNSDTEAVPVMEREEEKETSPTKEMVQALLVEDNKELLTLMKDILSRNYRIFTAENGVKALSIVKDCSIDIVISDVMMPEMNGLELCNILKGNLETSHIPIILLTAKNSTEDRIECYNAGADGYISKPFDLKLLEARINNFISHKKDKQKEFKSDVEINVATLEYPSIDEQFLNNAIEIIQEHMDEPDFDINMFAQSLHISKSSLYRKIKTLTGLSPLEFVRNIRLKQACQMLKDKSIPISEVAYAIGFSDPKYFTQCFKAEFNVTPSEFQKQNNIIT